jgi:hypothetical protein
VSGTTIIGMMLEHLRSVESESWRVKINDHQDDGDSIWVNVTILYDKIVDGVETEMQATFTVYWVSEHIWQVEIFNGSATWHVVTEINTIAAFYMAVGFEYVNE